MKRIVTYPKWLWRSCIGFLVCLLGLNLVFPPPLKEALNVSPVVLDREDSWLTGFSVDDGVWRVKADLDKIDPRFIERLIAIEDERFWNHSGVDVPAVFRAANSWYNAGKPTSGASTITMQLVRQIEPRERTVKSKALESFRALQYELFLSKEEILELYLTHISYGGNIEGIHAATFAYFGKTPEELTDGEIALLIAIPQAPEARRPDLWPNVARRGRDKILVKLSEKGLLTVIQTAEAKALPVNVKRNPLPETAWLSAYAIALDNQSVRSTMDLKLQREVEAVAANVLEELPTDVGIAVTVVENESMAVRAHMGSGGLERKNGWIDMTRRYRSPGSTLKPFIYGLAMDDGLVSAGSWIEDAPARFGSYRPENFNRRYYGDVRISEALQHSLNVPAVTVLDGVGGHRLESSLKNAGMDVIRLRGNSEEAGLALALGGAGVQLNDLAVVYTALANDGQARPLRWLEADPMSKPVRLLSEDTVEEITQIMQQSPTPEGQVPAWLSSDFPTLAYKTGTSYGFRDAWAAGYSDKWTIVVWVGRPDGAPRDGQTGRIAAAPVLFDLFAALPRSEQFQSYKQVNDAPLGLTRFKGKTENGPQILFPPEGAELLASNFGQSARGFTLSARSSSEVHFYVDGHRVVKEGDRSIWRPNNPGFYEIRAVDDNGQVAKVRVSVLALSQIGDPRF